MGVKFLPAISQLNKTAWSWELRTWSYKMNLIDTSTNSPHYFYSKRIGITNDNLNFDVIWFKGVSIGVLEWLTSAGTEACSLLLYLDAAKSLMLCCLALIESNYPKIFVPPWLILFVCFVFFLEYALLQEQLKTILYAKMNVPLLTILCFLYHSVLQGPVVRRPMSANPGLNFNAGFFFFCSKTPRKISLLFLEHKIIKL